MALEYEVHPLLVLVGAFNPQIMRNPQWIKNFLFPNSSQKNITVNMNLPLLGGELSSTMTIDGIRIQTEAGKVQIFPKEFTASGYKALAEVVVNLASALPHTPLVAYGINCRFGEVSSKPLLLKMAGVRRIFASDLTNDNLKLEYAINYKAAKMTVSVIENKMTDSFKISYTFNFHFQMDENEKSPMARLKEAILDGAIEDYLQHAHEVAESISSNLTSGKRGNNA